MRISFAGVTVLLALLSTTVATAKTWPNKTPPPSELGKEIYEARCTGCHGATAKGDGPAAAALGAQMKDLSEGFGQANREELARIVLRGKGLMPAFDLGLTREQVDAVVSYMATAGQPKPPPKEGAEGAKEVEEEGGGGEGDEEPAREAQPPG